MVTQVYCAVRLCVCLLGHSVPCLSCGLILIYCWIHSKLILLLLVHSKHGFRSVPPESSMCRHNQVSGVIGAYSLSVLRRTQTLNSHHRLSPTSVSRSCLLKQNPRHQMRQRSMSSMGSGH